MSIEGVKGLAFKPMNAVATADSFAATVLLAEFLSGAPLGNLRNENGYPSSSIAIPWRLTEPNLFGRPRPFITPAFARPS